MFFSVELHQCSVLNSFSKISDWRIVTDKLLWRILSVKLYSLEVLETVLYCSV